MKRLKVNLKERSYDVVIGHGALNSLSDIVKKLDIGRDAFIVATPIIKALYGSRVRKQLKKAGCSCFFRLIPDSEKAKSVSICINILNELAAYDTKKRIFIVALGGGVTGDLAGFIASVYRRGIPYIQIPTTLLSQVDSAVGGKVAIDLSVGKNLIGSFYQPRVVVSDISLLKSLPDSEIKNGLAEVVKYGLISDAEFFTYLEENYVNILKSKPEVLEHTILKCSKLKALVVEKDERDNKDIRIALNCGHTIGHAIEAAGGYSKYTHGEAVALGMVIEAGLACILKKLNPKVRTRLEVLLGAIGLPTRIEGVDLDNIMTAQEHDKKIISGVNRFVLPVKIGGVRVFDSIPTSKVRTALSERM